MKGETLDSIPPTAFVERRSGEDFCHKTPSFRHGGISLCDCDHQRTDKHYRRSGGPPLQVLNPDSFKHFITEFNANDTELYAGFISNSLAWDFLKDNTPIFDYPAPEINEIYYFRWWTYRKHISKTPAGYVITEFPPPVVGGPEHTTRSIVLRDIICMNAVG